MSFRVDVPSVRLLASRIADMQARFGCPRSVTAIANPADAVAAALSAAHTVCVAGSIFLAGAVRDALNRRDILH